MPRAHFFQECPTCGRHVRIKAEYLGRRMSCLHCEGEFVATDSESRFEAVESCVTGARQPQESLLLHVAAPAMASQAR